MDQADQKTQYNLSDVAQHALPTDCWTIINNEVYDLTPFVANHPGGIEKISQICGIDGTSLFEGQHGGGPQVELLQQFKIGQLAQ